jgi:rRNA maturation RNase YbeY
MIEFHSQTDFELSNVLKYQQWINDVAISEDYQIDSLGYVFCDDLYLHQLNVDHLQHDTLTDILTFDYTEDDKVSGEIYISIDRVKENALLYKVAFIHELHRVMSHGLLHMVGYNDSSPTEKAVMRQKEEEKIAMFHVKQ